MELVFVRHGQTDWNLRRLLQGRTDNPLNENGEEAARRVGTELEHVAFDAVFSSPLKRAVRTAELIRPNAEIRTDARLSEWNFGDFEGKIVAGNASFSQMWRKDADPIPNAERIEDVIARVSSFLDDLKAEFPNGRVLCVSHGGVSAAMTVAFYGWNEKNRNGLGCFPNTAPYLFSTDGVGPVPFSAV